MHLLSSRVQILTTGKVVATAERTTTTTTTNIDTVCSTTGAVVAISAISSAEAKHVPVCRAIDQSRSSIEKKKHLISHLVSEEQKKK